MKETFETNVISAGRIRIPIKNRKHSNIQEGDTVHVIVEKITSVEVKTPCKTN